MENREKTFSKMNKCINHKHFNNLSRSLYGQHVWPAVGLYHKVEKLDNEYQFT